MGGPCRRVVKDLYTTREAPRRSPPRRRHFAQVLVGACRRCYRHGSISSAAAAAAAALDISLLFLLHVVVEQLRAGTVVAAIPVIATAATTIVFIRDILFFF